MDSSKFFFFFIPHLLFITVISTQAAPAESKPFREYIGAESQNVTFSDVPINPKIELHFILSSAIDYTTSSSPPRPTNGDFKVYWDTENLSPCNVSSIKAHHSNVKVAMSLGGDTIEGKHVHFKPTSIDSWVRNAIKSITWIVRDADPDTFAECIGQLVLILKQGKVVSFASIAPYDDDSIQPYYLALWRKYGHLIDYNTNYEGGKVLVSLGTDGSGGLSPDNGFFEACSKLQYQGKLHGIFIWSADDSKKTNFYYEKQSQTFLAAQNDGL
ncbi:hypothetical protein ACB098_08G034900 [Castanea mollissima]